MSCNLMTKLFSMALNSRRNKSVTNHKKELERLHETSIISSALLVVLHELRYVKSNRACIQHELPPDFRWTCITEETNL